MNINKKESTLTSNNTFENSEYNLPELEAGVSQLMEVSQKDYARFFSEFKKHVTRALQSQYKNFFYVPEPSENMRLVNKINDFIYQVINHAPPPKNEGDHLKLAGEDLQEMIDIVASDFQVQKDFIDDQTKKMSPSEEVNISSHPGNIQEDTQLIAIQKHLAGLENYRKKFPVFQCVEDKQ